MKIPVIASFAAVSRPGGRDSATAERRLRRLLLGTIAILGPIILLACYYKLRFPGLTNPDALDFAQVGRNLASGRGFTTFFLRPLALTHGSNPLRQPDVVHGPLFSVCLAVAFSTLGARDNVAAGVSGLFFLLTIPVVYVLGKRAFSSRVGTAAALVFTLNALSLDYATSGLHITLCIFLTTSLLLTVYSLAAYARDVRADASIPLPTTCLALAGSLAALIYLTDPVLFWMVPAVGASIIWTLPARRGAAALWFLLPAVLLAAPWMTRNALLTGNPIFGLRGTELLMNTRNSFPGLSAYRMLPTEVFARPGLLQDVIRKVVMAIGDVLDSWPSVGGNWALVFFLPSLFFRFSDPAANSLRRVTLHSFVAVTAGMLLFQIQMPLLVTLVPGMLVFAVAYLMFLIQQAQLPRGATIQLTAALGAALLYPLFRSLALAEKPVAIQEREAAVALSTQSRSDDVVLSDQPWTVAWYANRPTILVPYTETKITDIRQQFPNLHWLFLTQAVGHSGPEWKGFYQGLLTWNRAYAAARERSAKPPNEVRVSGAVTPLLAALTGFVTYPPLEKGAPATLVAFAPPAKSGLPAPRGDKRPSSQ